MKFKFLKTLLKPTWKLPDRFVPSAQMHYLSGINKGLPVYRVVKYLKRRFIFDVVLPILGRGRRCYRIERSHQRILWINIAAPSLGDSLMDLASRTLLVDKDLILLTDQKNAALYSKDCYFKEVYVSTKAARAVASRKPFDLVICDSYSPRVLCKKIKVAPWVDFVGLYEFLNGFEVHRTYFAFARMMELLSLRHISESIRPIISVPETLDRTIAADVCVAIGGEWSFRTYDHWLPVVQWLVERGLSVTLVGSENGVEMAQLISGSISSVRSTVGRLSLPEVVGQIASCKAFIGADGGLWHIACAIPVPTVVLFADCQIFDEEGNRVTRETTDMVCETLYDNNSVSQIPFRSVIEACERLFARIHL